MNTHSNESNERHQCNRLPLILAICKVYVIQICVMKNHIWTAKACKPK